jgi:hypothetical protein
MDRICAQSILFYFKETNQEYDGMGGFSGNYTVFGDKLGSEIIIFKPLEKL